MGLSLDAASLLVFILLCCLVPVEQRGDEPGVGVQEKARLP
jgi:hypothetical protein